MAFSCVSVTVVVSLVALVWPGSSVASHGDSRRSPPNIYRKAAQHHAHAAAGESGGPAYVTKYFSSDVDHFNYEDNRTFAMRVLVNEERWDGQKGRPIIFYTGNEGPIDLFWNNSRFWTETVRDHFGGVVVFAEHRYFGETMPFGNKSFERQNIGYCTIEQVLEDYAVLLMRLQSTKYGRGPILAGGGSYGGMLAAWFRLKYPSLVTGSLAASAPVLQYVNMTDQYMWFAKVTEDFRSAGCADGIKTAFTFLEQATKTLKHNKKDKATAALRHSHRQTDERQQTVDDLAGTFSTCTPIENGTQVESLIAWMMDAFGELAMVDYPYPASFLGSLPAWPVTKFCEGYGSTAAAAASVSDRRGVWMAMRRGLDAAGLAEKGKCLNIQTTGEDDSLGALDGWDYLTCTTQSMPIGSNGDTDMFPPSPYNLTAVVDGCRKKYGVTPDFTWPRRYSNYFEGCSNIIFSNGLLDPWWTGSFHHSPSPSCVVLNVTEGAHHLDLRAPSDEDPLSVRRVRERELGIMQGWVDAFYGAAAAAGEERRRRGEEGRETLVYQ
ncbi:unnamed protein product [Vitrella brassicaformis CCMP3155]|uniref:Prolylcarboxypeptidase n=2 Tax=Vitrella brassicaformis TaxID=1169539 RepID=A0A0G4FLB3_VITBC|nr:unnamed protein product [Vitrella brassicaformis CCMP3155]|eukprot:CEM14792.1 unnamed protein product [Vitrella brassicaformis CCMP3155]